MIDALQWLPVLAFFVVLIISILVTRVASIALAHTGMSREAARFQARSAFTGSGFTTTEAEQVVNHPVRRRIIMILMLVGNAGLVSVISALILSLKDHGPESTELWGRLGVLVVGLVLLWGITASSWVDRRLSRWIEAVLENYTDLDQRDYASLMHLGGDYRLAELGVQAGDWMAEKHLAELKLRDEGVIILGIKRASGAYVGAPNGDSFVGTGDTLLVYGREAAIARLDRRKATMTAELRHDLAVEEQDDIVEAQREEDVVEPSDSERGSLQGTEAERPGS